MKKVFVGMVFWLSVMAVCIEFSDKHTGGSLDSSNVFIDQIIRKTELYIKKRSEMSLERDRGPYSLILSYLEQRKFCIRLFNPDQFEIPDLSPLCSISIPGTELNVDVYDPGFEKEVISCFRKIAELLNKEDVKNPYDGFLDVKSDIFSFHYTVRDDYSRIRSGSLFEKPIGQIGLGLQWDRHNL